MGFWDDVGDFVSDVGEAIADGADEVAGFVEDTVNAVEEVAADVVETVGNAIADGLSWVGDQLVGIPVIGGVLGGVFGWLGGIVGGVTDLLAGALKAGLGIIGGVLAGAIRVVFGGLGGLLAWDGRVFVKGWGDIFAGILGGLGLLVLKFVNLVQAVFLLERKRRLTWQERQILRLVFRGSVALYNVRISEGFAGILSVNDRAVTLGNTIYLKDHDPGKRPELLVHECVHVWQYQNWGSRYAADAVFAQWTMDDAYDWRAELSAGKAGWGEFNPEAQGQLFEDVYRDGRRTDIRLSEPGDFFDSAPLGPHVEFVFHGVNHTGLARSSTEFVRGARSWRLSGAI